MALLEQCISTILTSDNYEDDFNHIKLYNYLRKLILLVIALTQGFMQDKNFASHTCFGGHMGVNC